jgi:hypothetical protein
MSHSISGVAGTLLPPMLLGTRPNSPVTKKGAKPFQTIESDEANSVSQQQQLKQSVATPIALQGLTSPTNNTTVEQADPRRTGGLSTQGSASQLAGQRGSLNNSETATGSSGTRSLVAVNASLKSLERLANPNLTNGDPGSVVNVLI